MTLFKQLRAPSGLLQQVVSCELSLQQVSTPQSQTDDWLSKTACSLLEVEGPLGLRPYLAQLSPIQRSSASHGYTPRRQSGETLHPSHLS